MQFQADTFGGICGLSCAHRNKPRHEDRDIQDGAPFAGLNLAESIGTIVVAARTALDVRDAQRGGFHLTFRRCGDK